jgi:hypothetical protein
MRSAVLFLVFNRPNTTREVFEAIRKAKPPRLYVAADGPRPSRHGEAERCTQVRQIATAVDWPCDVKTLFREENMGCKNGVAGGISWFFQNEEEGIILEDDCLPTDDFFPFVDKLLERYRGNQNICAISGTTFDSEAITESDYYYSKYPLMWGWATWRTAWEGYRRSIPAEEISRYFSSSSRSGLGLLARLYWNRQIIGAATGKIDTWDYQWIYHCLLAKRLCIRPSKNLVRNIGFGEGATHTHDQTEPAAALIHHAMDSASLPSPGQIASNSMMDALDERVWLRLYPKSLFGLVFPTLHQLIMRPIGALRRRVSN